MRKTKLCFCDEFWRGFCVLCVDGTEREEKQVSTEGSGNERIHDPSTQIRPWHVRLLGLHIMVLMFCYWSYSINFNCKAHLQSISSVCSL